MDYDNWKLATPPHYEYDDEEQEEETTYETLTEAYNSGVWLAFENMQSEIIAELKIVYEALKATDNGLRFKVESLIKKMG
jgi:hypothetical protein